MESNAIGQTSPQKRSVGRPRDPQVERRLKQAALETLAKHGFSGLTLDRVCTTAGVPKATFYRRWPTPLALVIEAFNERFEAGLMNETDNLRADLIEFSDRLIDLYADPILGPCTASMITEAKMRPVELRSVMDAQSARRRHNRAVLERSLRAGGFETGLPAQLILSSLNGLAYFTYATGRQATQDQFALLIDKLLQPAIANH